MSVTLVQLAPQQLRLLVDGAMPADLPGEAAHGALPPAFMLARATQQVGDGQPPFWWLPFLILDDGRIVGGCAFKGPPAAGRVEVLYGIAPACRRKGYAAAALRALIDIAFDAGATEVLAEIEPRNLGSARTAERCGMVAVGVETAHDGVEVARYRVRRQGRQPA